MHSTKQGQNKLLQFIEKKSLISENDSLLLAVSGGSDSTALAILIKSTLKQLKINQIGIAHYNHCLRGEESDRDENFCKNLSNKLGFPFFSDKLIHENAGKKKGQLYYREARYAFLQKTAAEFGFNKIVTAHTKDDNVETVLMRIFSGTGISGLKGIPALSGNLVRPLLDFTREELENILKENCQNFVVDSSNYSEKYTRNSLRLNLLPQIEKLFQGSSDAVIRLSQTAAIEDEFLEKTVDTLYNKLKNGLSNVPDTIPSDMNYHPAIFRRLLMRLAQEYGIALSHQNITDIEAAYFQKSGGSKRLIAAAQSEIWLEYGNLVIKHVSTKNNIEAMPITLFPGQSSGWGNYSISIEIEEINRDDLLLKDNELLLKFDGDKILFPLEIRNIQSGDKMCIAEGVTKKISRLLIDKKIPSAERNLTMVILSQEKVIGIAAILPQGQIFRSTPETFITENTKKFVFLRIEKIS